MKFSSLDPSSFYSPSLLGRGLEMGEERKFEEGGWECKLGKGVIDYKTKEQISWNYYGFFIVNFSHHSAGTPTGPPGPPGRCRYAARHLP